MSPSQPKPFTPQQERRGDRFIKSMSSANTSVYRRSGGRVGGRFKGGAPVCLLTTIGRKSGEPRTMPLLYLSDGADVVIVASKGGFSSHPQWYHNLVANPEVTIEIGRSSTPMVARVASDGEKAALWPRLVAMYADYEDYQARTEREIPVIICSPAGGTSSGSMAPSAVRQPDPVCNDAGMDDLLIARVIAAGRVLFGTLCLTVPKIAFGPIGRDASGPMTFLIRLFGIRDLVLGAGALVALNDEEPDPRWVQFGAIADTADAVAAVAFREDLGRVSTAATLGLAIPASLLGWKSAFGLKRR